MKHFALETESVLSSSIAESVYETQDFHPLDLPFALRLKESEEQLEFLFLASILLLYRSSGGSDRAKFSWGFYEASSLVTQVSATLTDVIPAVDQKISQTVKVIRSLRQRSLSSASSISQNDIRWEDQHMFFAASHATGQPAPNDVSNYRIESRVIDNRFCVRQPQASSTTVPQLREYVHIQTFLEILQTLLSKQDQTVAHAIRIGQTELAQIWRWNAIVPPAIDRCMHDIIVEEMRKDPERPAVTSWDGDLTYGELDRLSSQLAVQLIGLGVGVGVTVPLCFEKSMWTVVGVLAIMRAGGGIVLTDPAQPEARLRTIMTEVDAKIVLTSQKQSELGSRILPQAQIVVVGPELMKTTIEIPSSSLPQVPASATLYVIFTSGSTGKPKGVVISHSNYTSGALPRGVAVGYKSHSRVLDFASYAFDVSIDCMLCTLSQGGCICVPSDEARVNDLSGAITSLKVNMAHMTPSVARVLPLEVLTSLEVLGLGGESLSPSDVSIWGQRTKVVNAYGPSECTVGCTINNAIPLGRTYTSIGKGVGGVTWIVDPEDHEILTPIDGVGELLIEGPIVGVGYINEPEKTAAVFIEDPRWLLAGHKDVPGRHGRLYKTGDLVKYDPDASGCVVFAGRKDRQVKVRGQRVELAEIEHHLHNYLPAEVTVAAEVIKPKGKEPTLVAFIAEYPGKKLNATDDNITVFSAELRKSLSEMEAALSEHLPVYMVPTAYIPLHEMPALVSCKTDRKKLQEIGNAMSHQQIAKFRATEVVMNLPVTEMEIKLQKLWIRLLGIDIEIGTNDNFFALGGDSLKAMRLVAAARGDGVSLTVANIFANPKLSHMAKTAGIVSSNDVVEIAAFSILEENWESEGARAEVAELCDIESTIVEDIYPCTPLQEGLMALSAKISEAYIAQRVVGLADLPTAHRLKDAFEVVALDSAILRTRIVQVPGHGLMQVVVNEKLSWSESSNLEEYLIQDREKSMGLGEPLARFSIVTDQKSGKVQMVLTIHHALYDGWGMPMIIERVNQAYRGMKINKRTPFKSFIKYIASSDRPSSAAYWKGQLDGASGPQFPAHPYAGYQAQTDSLLERYVSLARASASSTTVATAIRGAWAIVASNFIASNDIVFGETLTGRNAPVPGIEEIEGPLITTVPVRVRVNRKTRVSDFLDGIHQQTLQRIPHEHMGLQHIRRLSPDAREACELKTGLVLHPNAEVEENTAVTEDSPANAFVPAGDEEAAREALKFSSYALMLVCSLGPGGFLIMASFDSNCVTPQLMDGVLAEFARTVQQLCENPSGRIGDLQPLTEENKTECWKLSSSGPSSIVQAAKEAELSGKFDDVTATWIVDPNDLERLLPVGAIGELLVERPDEFFNPELQGPRWLFEGCADFSGRRVPLSKTGRLAKYNSNGTLSFVNRDAISAKIVDVDPIQETSTEMTPRQQELLRLWSRVLAIPEDEIHLTDSFFELGGDSIGAMKLVSEAKMEGLELTVAQIFRHRRLCDMAGNAQSSKPVEAVVEISAPFSALDVQDAKTFLSDAVVPALMDPTWEVLDVLPSRPLQEIAVSGTFKLPRYSARYELFYLDTEIDQARLLKSCQELVDRNEILRTVFIHHLTQCYSVILSHLDVSFSTYEIESPIEPFAKLLCDLDIQTKIPLGSPFIKFLFVKNKDLKQSCLILKISHSQYDEICLPPLLRQLSAIYENRPLAPTIPFSTFVYHILRFTIPSSIPYWRSLLAGSAMTVLPKPTVLKSRTPIFIHKYFSIASRPREVTVATLPTAAWALCLAQRLSLRDVTFGEVASGRNTTLANNDLVMGPCWQYIPMRVIFQPSWNVSDLLHYIQQRHIESTAHEGMGLTEIVKTCTDWPQETNWFDSVVHQDVEHVEKLEFLSANSRMETVYPHLEPLREWKVQAFPDLKQDRMAIEIVTFEGWKETAEELLEEMGRAIELLVGNGEVPLFRMEEKKEEENREGQKVVIETTEEETKKEETKEDEAKEDQKQEKVTGSEAVSEEIPIEKTDVTGAEPSEGRKQDVEQNMIGEVPGKEETLPTLPEENEVGSEGAENKIVEENLVHRLEEGNSEADKEVVRRNVVEDPAIGKGEVLLQEPIKEGDCGDVVLAESVVEESGRIDFNVGEQSASVI